MLHTYALYWTATGQIFTIYTGVEANRQLQAGQSYKLLAAENITDYTHRVDVGLLPGDAGNLDLVAKIELPGSLDKANITADGADMATISGLPTQGGAVSGEIVGQAEITAFSDGVLGLTFDTPGTYTARLVHPLYLPREWTITAS